MHEVLSYFMTTKQYCIVLFRRSLSDDGIDNKKSMKTLQRVRRTPIVFAAAEIPFY